MTDIYIRRRSTFFINKLIICQDAKKKRSLLYYLKDILTRFLSLPLGFLLVDLGTQLLGPTYFSYIIL